MYIRMYMYMCMYMYIYPAAQERPSLHIGTPVMKTGSMLTWREMAFIQALALKAQVPLHFYLHFYLHLSKVLALKAQCLYICIYIYIYAFAFIKALALKAQVVLLPHVEYVQQDGHIW